MNSLKGKTVTTTLVKYYDLEKLVDEIYGTRGWSFVVDQEAGNDSEHSFDVSGKLHDYEIEDVENFINDKEQSLFLAHAILNDLGRKGHIPLGRYTISVSW